MVDPRLAQTEYLVEATSFESMILWQRRGGLRWEQDPSGIAPNLGTEERPNLLQMLWVRINGHLVAFIEPVSRYVDWDAIDEWLARHCPNVKRRTDAMNFHNVRAEIDP